MAKTIINRVSRVSRVSEYDTLGSTSVFIETFENSDSRVEAQTATLSVITGYLPVSMRDCRRVGVFAGINAPISPFLSSKCISTTRSGDKRACEKKKKLLCASGIVRYESTFSKMNLFYRR